MEGVLPLNSTCGELSVLCGVRSSQGFPRAGSAVRPAAGHVHQHRAAMGGQRGAAQGPRFLPLLSPKPWNFIQMDLTPSLNSPCILPWLGYSCGRRGRSQGEGVGGERLAPSLPKRHERAVTQPAPGLACSFEDQQLTHPMGSGPVHLGCTPPAVTAEGERK